ncbi:cation transporter dimerization domain-containing protein [Lysinibacillus sp. NPDC093190]|uniref:cation transporter dimerization domain-containing protein n=1 Tax=Lysinibacillus sp. NPDC093190 TaxID=3390575 RepID=UPI003D081FAF
MHAREHGHYKPLDIRLSLNHDLNIKQGHDIGREIKNEILNKFPGVGEFLIQ